MNEWSLDALYKGFEDEKFQQDIKELQKIVDETNFLSLHLAKDEEIESCERILTLRGKKQELMNRLCDYCYLRRSANTKDSKATSYLEQLLTIFSNGSKADSAMDHFIADMHDLDAAIAVSPLIKEHAFYVKQIKENSTHLLRDDVEEIITKMDMNGGSAWSSLQDYLTSSVEIKYGEELCTLSQIRNMAYDSDANVRKQAYEAELAGYASIRDAIAFSLNSIKGQVNIEASLRGYESPLAMALASARMEQSTLQAMLSAITKYLPVFHTYLKHKAKLLGYQNGLPWYELFAPLGKEEKTYRIDEAKEYIVSHFRPFANDMADMMETAFDEEWIDFYPRKGKVGGAFCANLSYIKQSRVLTNYDGSLGDIVTLSHELGHAYHGMMIENHTTLNTEYSMPVAETASTFNENIIMNALIDEAQGDTKIMLIENQLQDLAQIICDIYSRYLFESEVFARRENEFMFADELEKMMLSAQQKAYGDGLDPNFLHPYMWVCKSHYYSSNLSFYNFPYAFGGLFARGLIVKYQEEGEPFVEKYRKLLHATTITSVEDAAKVADIDLRDPAFWESALQTCVARINEFIALTSK